eukprot:182492-Chlamydomonas_euryale.AAC.2
MSACGVWGWRWGVRESHVEGGTVVTCMSACGVWGWRWGVRESHVGGGTACHTSDRAQSAATIACEGDASARTTAIR